MKTRIHTMLLAGNTGTETAPLLAGNGEAGQAVFQLEKEGGFFVPFGEYPHKLGVQRFDRQAAEQMLAHHRGEGFRPFTKLKRWLGGNTAPSYPVYIGHPDIPGSGDSDKRAYGWIHDMRIESKDGVEGMSFDVRYGAAGNELIEGDHFRFYSPTWWLGKGRDGALRPVAFKSMGLTNNPNIPVPALGNEHETETEDMDPEILKALGLEEGANAADAVSAIEGLRETAGRTATAETAANEASGQLETLQGDLERVNGELTAANEQLDNLRQTLIGNAVDAALSAGRILPSEADETRAALAGNEDLLAGIAELEAREVKLKTTSATGDLGGAKARLMTAHNDATAAAREERRVLVANEYEATNPALSEPERKRIAWQRAAAKNPELFNKQSPDAAA